MIMIRRFSALFSATRTAQAVVSGHIPIPRPSQRRHHENELLLGVVARTATSVPLPSQRLSIQDHVSRLHRGLLPRQFMHSNARVEQTEMINIEIISEENIKPASQTPDHLRTFKLSILDQFFFPSYTPCILYFHNTAETGLMTHDSMISISNKSKNLKASLSELLTRFYPFAGRIKDDFEIECNDQGVYFAEARVNCRLLDFLSQPDDQTIQGLIPRHPSATASTLGGNYVVSVQVNVFDCGGIALSTSVSHKLIDGSSYFTFLNAWAATSRGSSKVIHPSFIATSLFPQSRYLHVDGLLKMCTDLFEVIDEGDCLVLTSLCKSGIYEIDFGWGRPVWFSYINPGVSRIVALADTVKGDGIEATVSLSPEEMAIFECDPELLSYASADLSPLKLLIRP